jgi:hypothetical protein
MLLHLALTVSLVAQSPVEPPVRVWMPDTLPQVGEEARLYVRLGSTGHLLVLHADASGQIRVLFPDAPTDADLVPGGKAFEVAGPLGSGSVPVRTPGPGLVLAIRSAYPFALAGLEASGTWDYDHALLLQPTAGNQFAALLDIADRVTAGRAYQYDQVGYRTPGSSGERVTSGAAVCLECFTAHAGSPETPAATATATTAVDCSNATLVDSFCGVQDNRTYVTEQAQQAPVEVSGYPVVEPLYVPVSIPSRRRLEHPHQPPPSPTAAIAIDPRLRVLSDPAAPPPIRRRPTIVVHQPRAPSRPRVPDTDGGLSPDVAPSSNARPQAPFVPRATSVALPVFSAPPAPTTAASRWTAVPASGVGPVLQRAALRGAPTAASASLALPAMRGTLVPSRAFIRSLAGRPR